MNEETIKIRYNVTYEKSYTFPAHANDEDCEIEERIYNEMPIKEDEYTDAKVIRFEEPTIIDRGF